MGRRFPGAGFVFKLPDRRTFAAGVTGSPSAGMDERHPAVLSREINGRTGDGENGPYVSDR